MKIIKAQAIHAKQIIKYLSITCYWKEFVEGNSLNQSYDEFMLEWIINPRIPYTYVLVKDDDINQIFGCVITATSDELSKMPDYTPHLHTRVMDVFSSWFQFPVADSVVLELFALDQSYRGKGYGSKLFNIVEKVAQDNKKDTIACFVWSYFPDSLITLTRKGMMVMDSIKFPAPVTMPLLYMEKKPDYIKMKDYFQSEQYINITNMLLT